MKFKTFFYVLAILAVSLVSCKKDNDCKVCNDNSIYVNAKIGEMQTRAKNASWSATDAIGIYMYKSGQTLAGTNALAANKKFTTPGDGKFTPASAEHAILFPEDNSNVDFVAYYPHTTAITADLKYTVDVAQQTNQEAIDLLYSNSAKTLNASATSGIDMTFAHQLAKIVLNLQKDGIADLAGITVTIGALNTKADFSLVDGTLANASTPAAINMHVAADGSVAEAIVIPADVPADAKIIFTLGGKTYTYALPAGTKFEKSKKYVYNVKVKGSGVAVVGKAATITDWVDTPSQNVEVLADATPEVGTGAGTQADPYSVDRAFLKSGETEKWVTGVVVGVSSVTTRAGSVIGGSTTTKTHILLAKAAGETDLAKCIAVELPDGSDLQKQLNVADNASLVGKIVKVKGNIGAGIYSAGLAVTALTAQEGGVEIPVNPGSEKVILLEPFGVDPTPVVKFDYTGDFDKYPDWANKALTYEKLGKADIRARTTSLKGTKILWIPSYTPTNTILAGVKISGLDLTGYSNIKLSYDITGNLYTAADIANVNYVTLKIDGVNLEVPNVELKKAEYGDAFYTVTININKPFSEIVFEGTSSNTVGMRLDNIKIVGTK